MLHNNIIIQYNNRRRREEESKKERRAGLAGGAGKQYNQNNTLGRYWGSFWCLLGSTSYPNKKNTQISIQAHIIISKNIQNIFLIGVAFGPRKQIGNAIVSQVRIEDFLFLKKLLLFLSEQIEYSRRLLLLLICTKNTFYPF